MIPPPTPTRPESTPPKTPRQARTRSCQRPSTIAARCGWLWTSADGHPTLENAAANTISAGLRFRRAFECAAAPIQDRVAGVIGGLLGPVLDWGCDRRQGRRRWEPPAPAGAARSAEAVRGGRDLPRGVQARRGPGRRPGDLPPGARRAPRRHRRRDAPGILPEPDGRGRGGLRGAYHRRLPLGGVARRRGGGRQVRRAPRRDGGGGQVEAKAAPLRRGVRLRQGPHGEDDQGDAPEPEPLRQLLVARALEGGVPDAGWVPRGRSGDPARGG